MSLARANFARQTLPWGGLFCLWLAAAQLVHVAAAALPAPVTAPLVITTNPGMPADVASPAGSRSVVVMITVQDATTGIKTDMLCRATGDRTASDTLLMDAETARDVLPALCEVTWLPAPFPNYR